MEEVGLKISRMETIVKTAELFNVSQYFVRKLANSGKIKAVRISGRILINCDKFAEYLNNVTLQDSLQEDIDTMSITADLRKPRLSARVQGSIRRLG